VINLRSYNTPLFFAFYTQTIMKDIQIKGDVNMEIKGLKMEKYKGKVEIINRIVKNSTRVMLEDSRTYTMAVGVGLWQGLKYNGSFKRGAKAGAATVSVMVGANIIQNIIINLDEIKNA
jgi:hypothetical protein